jgi:hypothetical protein
MSMSKPTSFPSGVTWLNGGDAPSIPIRIFFHSLASTPLDANAKAVTIKMSAVSFLMINLLFVDAIRNYFSVPAEPFECPKLRRQELNFRHHHAPVVCGS